MYAIRSYYEQGDVEYDQLLARICRQEIRSHSCNCRMDDRFKALERLGVAENGSAQFLAVDAIRARSAGKRRFDQRKQGA